MENKCKRFLSLLLALTMVIGMIPFGHAHAEEEETVVTLEQVTAVQANEDYVIFYAGTNRAMANSTRTWAKGAGMDTGVISEPSENYLWTLVPVDDVEGGYMIYNSAAAKYITISQNNAALSEDSGDVFKFTYTENGFVIKAEGVEYGYFNNLGGENIVGGWNSDGTKFDVCKVVEKTLDEVDPWGKRFWTKVSVDTETVYDASEGLFEYAWDNDSATIWHSNWQGGVSDKLDAEGETFSGEIDFVKEYTINWFSFTPRQGNNSGQVTQASLYVKGADDADWTLAGQNLTFAEDQTEKKISFEEKAVRYVKFVAEASNDGWVAVSEFNIGYDAPDPVEPTDPTEPTAPVEPENAFTSVLISGITGTASSNDDGDGSAVEEAFDGIKDNDGNYWASVNNASGIEGNEYLIANLGGKYLINQVAYTRRTAGATAVGNLKDYVIWVSTDGETWEKVAEGTMEDAATVTIPFTPVEATHVKLTATQSHHWQEANLNKVMAVAEFEVFQAVCETHTPGEAATCTTAQTCTVCHAELAPATGHTWDNDCDADCNTCGEIREAAHNYIAEVTDPTCTSAGSATYICDLCGDTYTEDIPATGHQAVTTGAVNPTLCLPGQTGTTVCATCGETIGEDTQIGELPVATVLNGDTLIALSDCEYTYNPGSFTHTDADGNTYYVKPAAGNSSTEGTGRTSQLPQTTTEFTGITLDWENSTIDGTVWINGNGSMHVWTNADKPYWDKCGSGHGWNSSNGTHDLYLFRATGHGTGDVIPGYTQVTSAEGMVIGENYLIAAKKSDDAWYVMHPSSSSHAWDHIALVSSELRPVAHVYGDTVIENQVEPTCTMEGSYETVCYCTICGVELNRTHYTTPPIEHTRSEAVAENRFEPTCTMEGSYESVVYCSVCNYEMSRDRVTIPATGHTEGEAAIENQFDPTCTMDGVYETVVRCTVCNEIVTSETTTVPATGHTEGEAVVENNVEPTLNSEGSYDSVVYCSICNEELSRVTVTIPALTGAVAQIGQVKYESFDAALAAAQTGDTIYLLDPNGVEITEDTTYNLSGLTIESEGDVFVVTGGTLTLNGSGTVKGGTAGVGSWTAIWANGGNVVINGGTYSVGGDSTATETDHQNDVIYTKNGGTVTINGGTFLNDGTVWTLNENDANRGTITVYGGTFENWNPADNSSEGAHTSFLAEGHCAAEANGTYTVQAHDYEGVVTAPTCTEAGFTTYTCVHCGDTYTADQVDALGHTAGEEVTENVVDATCTKDGSYDTVVYCSVCGEEVTRDTTTVPAKGHTPGEAVVENEVAPTLNSEGSYDTVVYCTVCNEELSRVTTIVPALTGAVAQIGETKYASFEEALAAAVDGDTIVLLSKDGIEITEDTTYDLSGLTIESEGDVFVVTGGTLTLNGSGTVKGGTSGVGSWTAIWANGGHVVINGGSYSVGGDSTATETDHQNDVIYTKNGGTVTINGGTFLNDGTVWTLNENDANRGTITVYGGSFQNWNPADNSSEGAHTSFLAEGHCSAEADGTYTVQAHDYEGVVTAPTCTEGGYTTYTCVHCGDTYTADQVDALGHTEGEAVVENNVEPTLNSTGSYDTVVYCTVCDAELSRVTTIVPALTGAVAQIGETKYASFEEALAAAVDGDTIVLLSKDGIEITEDTTYDLSGLTVESEGDVFVVTGGTLTLNGSGTVKGGTAGVGSWTAIWANGGHVVINGGTYSVGGDSTATETDHQNDVIYTKNGGTVTINGGTFLNDGTVWTLNENDANRGTITVYGGSFQNWNPADNSSEGPHTDFVADGYCAAEANGYYTVQAHDYESVVTAPTCTEAGYTTCTCIHCGDTYTANQVDALGHTAGEEVTENIVDATCTKDGSYDTVVYCSVCDAEVSRVTTTVSAKGHTPGEAVVENEVAPTLNSEGSYDTVVYCTVCNEELSRVTTIVPALTGAVAQIGETKYASFEEALAAAVDGDTIVLLSKDGIEITEDTTYDLSGLTVESEGDVFVVTGGTLTLNGSGTVKGGTSSTGSWTAIWANGGNVVINGGTYSVGGDSTATETDHQNDVIYTKNGGTVTINGGTFLNDGTVWTLNENDANRGTITVYGGTFQNWNPADNSSEGAHTSFLAEGHCSAETDGTYTVQAHAYESFVTAPTCTDKGYTTHTCVHCGDSYTADETPALGHAFENGTCTICGTGIAVNLTTGSTYAVLADALNAAVAGDTVQLLGDTFESNVLVYPEITLDLNSNDLTADYVVGFIDSHILDGKGGGKLIAAERNVVVDKNNKMIPLYDENGFVFTTVGFTLRRDENYTGDGIKINALVLPQDMYAVDLLRDGAADNHIQIMIRLSWDAADSVGSQNFLFKDEVVQAVYSSNKGSTSVGSYGQMFTMVVTGIENVENLRANIVIVSDTNTERTPDSVSIYE